MKHFVLLGTIFLLFSVSAKSQNAVVNCSNYALNTNRDSLTVSRTAFQVLDLKFISGTQTAANSEAQRPQLTTSVMILPSLVLIDDNLLRKKNTNK